MASFKNKNRSEWDAAISAQFRKCSKESWCDFASVKKLIAMLQESIAQGYTVVDPVGIAKLATEYITFINEVNNNVGNAEAFHVAYKKFWSVLPEIA